MTYAPTADFWASYEACIDAMAEQVLIKQILLAASERGHQLWRQNVGFGWTGTVRHRGDVIEIRNARPLHAGLCKGSSDLIGFTRDGLFLAIEVKAGRTATTDDQIKFIDAVNKAGGRAGVARSVPEALAIMENTDGRREGGNPGGAEIGTGEVQGGG